MKIPCWTAAAALMITAPCLLAGCQKSDPFASGNHAPVNEAAMPTPDLSATDGITSGTTATPPPASTPGTPPPSLVPPNPLPKGP
jgi:hypothetical protein